MTRAAKLLAVPLFMLQAFFFTFIAWHRFVEVDEGFYLMASRLVLVHKKPYLDFFYTQAPLLPYVYALWMRFTSISWTSAKLLSALLTAGLGTLLYVQVCRLTQRALAGLTAVLLFACTTLVFAWLPVVKTFSLAGLCLFASYVIISRAQPSRWAMVIGGVLFGLSVETRSYLLLLVPMFLWWIFRNAATGVRLTSVLPFLAGFVVALLPALYLFFRSPELFLFNNLGYHALRSGAGLIGMWGEKLRAILASFLGRLQGNGIQNSILFFVSFGFLFLMRRHDPSRFAFQLAVALGLVSLLPTPVFPEYFCLCVPFLIVSAVCAITHLVRELETTPQRLAAAIGCIALIGIYVASSIGDFRGYLVTGYGALELRATPNEGAWRLEQVVEVSRAVDQIARPGEIVASFAPMDIFQTKANPLPGLESDFGLPVSERLTPQQRLKYHILSVSDLQADFAAHWPRVVVVRSPILMTLITGASNKWSDGEQFRSSLIADGYTLVRSIGGISIYAYPPQN